VATLPPDNPLVWRAALLQHIEQHMEACTWQQVAELAATLATLSLTQEQVSLMAGLGRGTRIGLVEWPVDRVVRYSEGGGEWAMLLL